MVPDKGFKKQLQALDPELTVMWDWGSEKWEIWRFPKNGAEPHHVMTVRTKDKDYRELGTDILLKLREADTSRFTTKQLIAYFEELDNQVRRRKEKELKDKIDAVTRDTKPYLFRIMGKPIRIKIPAETKVRRIVANA